MSQLWTPATRVEWERLAGQEYLPLTQSWEWGEAKGETGERVERFISEGGGGVQLQRRHGVAWAAGAPIGRLDSETAATLARLSRQVGSPILLSPYADLPGTVKPLAQRLFLSGTVLLDLTLKEEEIRRQLHGKWRNGLSKAVRARIEIEDGSFADMMSMVQELADAKGFHVPYEDEFVSALKRAFGKGFTIRIARHSGALAGSWLDLQAGSTATYLLGATTQAGRAVNASYLLAWDAIERHRLGGATTLDLGGIDLDRNRGPSEFKARMGGKLLEFPGTFLLGGGAKAMLLRALLKIRGSRGGRPGGAVAASD